MVRTDTAAVGGALARGWGDFFLRLLAAASLLGGVLHLLWTAVTGMSPGALHRWRPKRAGRGLAVAVATSLVVTGSAAGLTVVSARDQLAGVQSLADLTGTAPLVPAASPAPAEIHDVTVAVIGDSTAAGVGNAPLADPHGFDETCGRSGDAYAVVLASALRVAVANLACSSATIATGLLAPQVEGNDAMPAQVGVLRSLPALRVVVVSIGANDIGWSDFLRACYGLPRCDDQVSASLARSRIERFRLELTQLLVQLSALPTRPKVVIAGYYDPFGEQVDCPALLDPHRPDVPPPGYGFATPSVSRDAERVVREKVGPLRSFLAQLNTLLGQGAAAFGFDSVPPTFAGHELCSAQPWVQGMSERYPFHPNAAGELAIAASLLPELATLAVR